MGSIPTVLKSSKIQKQYLHTVNTWKANSAIVEAHSVTLELINDQYLIIGQRVIYFFSFNEYC